MHDLPSIPGFRLIRQLGSGGMGVVYLAVQESLDRQVAIKCLSAPQGDSDRQVRRFLNEGRTLARLTHANVVCVFDVRSPPPLMVMEYLAGGTLSERARSGVTLAEVLCFIAQVASGLAFVHRARIVHRDIKPPNIMFRSPHVAVLTDFGIAKESGQDHSLTQTGQVIGTTAYMSPEQLGTGEADGRSDQYSLGIVLYELLAGRRPFLGSTFYELAMQQLSRRPDPLTGPVAIFDPIVQRMLAKSPEQRFPDCDSLVEALRALVRAEASLEAQLGLQGEDPISEQLRQLGFGGSSRRAGAIAPTDKSSVMVGSAANEAEAPVSDSSRKGAAAQASLGHLGAALRSAVFELHTLQAAVAELPLDTGSKLDMEVKYQLLAAVARACTELEQLDGLQQLSGLIDRLSTRFPDWREWASLSESCHVRVGQLQTAAHQRLQAESCYEAALVALRAYRLLPPEPDNALDCLQQALVLDPAHVGAKALLAKLPEAVELTADRLHHAGDQAAALALVRSGLEVFPGHEELDELRRMLEQELRMQTLERERDARLLALTESVATGKVEALVDAILVLVELNEVARLAPAGQHLLASVVQQLESLTRGDGVAIDALLEGLGSFSAMVEVPQLQHFPGRLQAHRQHVRQLSRLAAERAAAEAAERARRAEVEAQEAIRRREAEAREAAERAHRAEAEAQEAARRREAEAREAAERARRTEEEAQEAARRREAEAREAAERARRAEEEAQEAARRREAEAHEAAERARRAEEEAQEQVLARQLRSLATLPAELPRRAVSEFAAGVAALPESARPQLWAALDREGFAAAALGALTEARLGPKDLADWLTALASAGVSAVALVPLRKALQQRANADLQASLAQIGGWLTTSAAPDSISRSMSTALSACVAAGIGPPSTALLVAALQRATDSVGTLPATRRLQVLVQSLQSVLSGDAATALMRLAERLEQQSRRLDEAGRKAQAERERQAAEQALQSELAELRRALPPGNLRLTEWHATLQRLVVLMQEPIAAAVSEVLEQLVVQLLEDLARADGEALAAIAEIRSSWARMPGSQAAAAAQRIGVAIGARRAALEQQAIAGHRQAWLSRFLALPTAEDLVEAERDARLHGCARDWPPSTQRQFLAAVRQLVRSLLDQEAVTAADELCQRLPLLGDLAGLSALLAELRPQLYAARAQLDARQRRQQWLQSLEGLRQGFPGDQPASPEQWREALHRLGEVAVHEDADRVALQACISEWSARAVQQLAAASAAELDARAKLEPAWAALAQRQLPGAVSATDNYQHALRARREQLAAEMRRHRRQAWIERFARSPKPEAFAELADPVLADSAPDWSRAEAQAVGEAVSRLLMPMLQAGELDRVQQLLEQLKTVGTHPQLGKATAALQAGLSERRRAEEAQRLKVEDATADHQRWRKTLVPYYRDGAAATSDLDWLLGFSEVLPPESLAESLQAWQHRAAEWVERGQAEGLSQSARWLTSLAASSLTGLPMGRLSDANRSLEERLQEQAAAEQRERDHAVHSQALEQAATPRKARPAVEAVLTMIRAADGSSQARAWSVQLRRRIEGRARRALAADQPDEAQAWLSYVPSEWDAESTAALREQASQAAEAARTALIAAAAAADSSSPVASSSMSTDATPADPAAVASIDQRAAATELRASATESVSANSVLPNRESDPDAPGPAGMATPVERPALTHPKPTAPGSAPASAASYPSPSPSSASQLPPSGARSVAWIGAAIVGIALILLSWWLLRQAGSESSTAPPGRPHESVTTPSAAVRQATMPGLMVQHSCAVAVLRLT